MCIRDRYKGGLPHLSGLPHLPGVPHLHVNRPLISNGTKKKTNKETSDVFFCISLEWLRRSVFGKEISVGLKFGLVCKIGLNCSYLTETWILLLESWYSGTCTSCTLLSDGFYFLLVKCAFKSGVRRSYLAAHFGFFEIRTSPWSPSKVEVSTFYRFTLKVGSMYT